MSVGGQRTDGELLQATRAGEGPAFATFYRRHLPRVVAFLMRETGDREVSADLAAEVFAAVLVSARRFRSRDGGSAWPWVRGIAQNKLRDSRRRGRVEDRARRRLALEPESLDDDDLARVDELASGPGVLALVDELPPRQRAAITGRIVHGREYADIAAQLECSEMVVRQQVSRGLARLAPGRGAGDLVYVAWSAQPDARLGASLGVALARLRVRLASVRPALSVARDGDRVIVSGVTPATRTTVQTLVRPARLQFYDWEANALTPNGKTVASQLGAQDANAVTISQGAGTGPGLGGGGGLSLYRAVKLASRQAGISAPQARLSRVGPLYYLFGAPGSATCAAMARRHRAAPVPGGHCLLAGPGHTPQELRSEQPADVTPFQGEQLTVPQGTVVLQAAGATTSQALAPPRPTARFYVLRDNVSLSGAAITDPQQSTDQSGAPDVSFGFTASGESQFQKVTQTIAHRGSADSPVGASKQYQHFAVALDTQLVTVPYINWQTDPDGLTGGGGADITGGFTTQSARELSILLRSGPLPVDLVPLG